MKEKWRLIIDNAKDAYKNMAVDRAILTANSEKKVLPTVRFYQWSPPAISIGYFQSLKDEIDINECEKQNVDYVRRITGGGAVFHEDELTYSIIIPESHSSIPENILDSYSRICRALIFGLENIGVKSRYRPINDIVVKDRKISGNAQTRKKKTVLQHGTVLMDVNVERMFSLLKVPNEKRIDKMIANVKESVTSIKNEVGYQISFKDLSEAMAKGFEKEFNVEFEDDKLTDYEKKLASDFEKNCFSKKSWIYKR